MMNVAHVLSWAAEEFNKLLQFRLGGIGCGWRFRRNAFHHIVLRINAKWLTPSMRVVYN